MRAVRLAVAAGLTLTALTVSPAPHAAAEGCIPGHPVSLSPFALPPAAPSDTVAPGTVLTGLSAGDGGVIDTYTPPGYATTWTAVTASWLKDGVPVSDDKTYPVAPSDAGSTLQQVVLLRLDSACDLPVNTALTPPVVVASPRELTAQLVVGTFRSGKRPIVRVSTTPAGDPEPVVGIIKAAWKGLRNGVVYRELLRSHQSRLTLRLPALPPGRYKLNVTLIDYGQRGTHVLAPPREFRIKQP